MLWLRTLLYLSPLMMAAAAVTLFQQVAKLQLPGDDEALTTVISDPVGPLNPFVPDSGVTGEIVDLVFSPLVRRDDELKLQPGLLKSWSKRTVITVRCETEEDAGETEARILAGELIKPPMVVAAMERVGSVLTIALAGFDPGLDAQLAEVIGGETLGNYLVIRLTLKHSIQDSMRTFLAGSVEKVQIKMIDYADDTTAYLFAKGDTDLLIREIELYYESNRSLDPSIEVLGNQAFTSIRELALEVDPEARWHDGKHITARDLVFSYELLTRSDSPLPLRSAFWYVESVEATGEYSVSVRCRETPSVMMECWEKLPLLPAHLLEGKLSAEDWAAYFSAPVASGPYRVEGRRADGGIALSVHPGFPAPLPSQQRLVYRRFDSLESKLLAIRAGKVDALVPDQRFEDWVERNPGSVEKLSGLPRFQHLIAWNLDRPPFDQVEARLALAHAVEIESILEDSATEFRQPVSSLFRRGVVDLDQAMPLPGYDPEKAEELLTAVGYGYDPEKQVRVNAAGEVLEFSVLVNRDNRMQLRLVQLLAEQWGALGISVDVEALSWSEILSQRLPQRDFDGLTLSWEIPVGVDRYTTWHSNGGEEAGNLFGLSDERVDQWVETLRFGAAGDEIETAATSLNREVARLQPCLFLCETGRILWLRQGAVGLAYPEPDGLGKVEPLVIGNAGLETARPWWVRREVERESQAGEEAP